MSLNYCKYGKETNKTNGALSYRSANYNTYMRQFGPLHHEMLLSHKAASEVYEQPQTLDWKVGATICGYGIASAHLLLSSGHSLLYQGIFLQKKEN